MSDDSLYVGREQSFVKHFILQKYLERFAHIVGFKWQTITYVDCFSGPWNVRSPDLADSSFSIALQELRKARETHINGTGKLRNIRCMFLEESPGPFGQLKHFADSVSDAIVESRNEELITAIPHVIDFVQRGGNDSFPFIFIDPTGWSGLDMHLIGPLLRFNPGEALINFMTDYVRRFVNASKEQPQLRDSMRGYFGSEDVLDRIEGLVDPQDREDELFSIYAENLRKTGSFRYVCAAIVLHPQNDRSYFHLIYATRHRRGVEVFKDVERRAMDVMEQTRAIAQRRGRIEKTKQGELFEPECTHRTRRIEQLRGRYLQAAYTEVMALLGQGTLPYDSAYDAAMAYPLVWEADLKEWIKEWVSDGSVELQNLAPAQRVPQLESNHLLKLK